ncbi:MAG TPA: class I SAM-dependent methyltransferase [Niastella sp.]
MTDNIKNSFDESRDYSSISPSAKSLLLMKGYTNIPYARQMAALIQGPEPFDLNFDDKDFGFWLRVMHFESRYWSIDQLLKQTDNKNIIELSSGYSLRGLEVCTREAIHYIDTDLPEVIATKQQIINDQLLGNNLIGELELLPLNAMNAAAFNIVVNRFASGPVTIVNEGLLMYLNQEEKKQLCKTIHRLLKERGGCWITADVYIKRSLEMQQVFPHTKGEAAFFEQHNIENNKFDSYEAAETFFKEQGFEIVKEATPNFKELSVLPHLLKTMPPEFSNSETPPPKIQATWMLKV